MTSFLFSLLSCAAVMSCVSLCFMLLSYFLRNKWSARGRMLVWWVLSIGFLLPVKPRLADSLITFSLSSPSAPAAPVVNYAAGTAVQEVPAQQASVDPLILLFGGWLFGAICMALFFVVREYRFRQHLQRWASFCPDPCQDVAIETAKALNVADPAVYSVPELTTPMLTGLFRPVILLPEKTYGPEELRLIVKHELLHFKRRDLWLQLCFLICRTIYWFNPFMIFFGRAMNRDCELACDEAVAEGESAAAKKLYCSALLTSAYDNSRLSPVLTGSFGCKKKQLKKRLQLIITGGKQRKLGALCAMAAIAVAFSGTFFSLSVPAAAQPPQLVETTTVASVSQEELSTVTTTTWPNAEDYSVAETQTWPVPQTTYPAPESEIAGDRGVTTTVKAEIP